MPERNFYVIAYDIPDNRRGTKVSKALENLGDRVNLSVFECALTKSEYGELLETLNERIDKRKDVLILYPLCLNCHGAVRNAGRKIKRKLDESLVTV